MNLAEALKKYGGEQANATIRKRVDFSFEGGEKSGKSFTALSAPGPLAFLDYDQRADEALSYWQERKDIIHVPIQIPKEKLMLVPEERVGRVLDPILHEEIKKVRAQVRGAFATSLASGARSIVVDTGCQWWSLERLAEHGKMDKVPPLKYTALNEAFETILRSVRLTTDRDVNLILTHRVKPVYVPDGQGKGGTIKSSRVEPTGYPHMGNVVQATLRMEYDEAETPPFKATVRTCGLNPYWVGQEFTGEEVDFAFIASCLTRMTGEDEDFDDEGIRLEAMMEREEWET